MLSELLQQILLAESASVNDISTAIDKHSRVIINYESKVQEIASGARVIDVYAYGTTKTGNEAIRAYQPYGDTASSVPSWKLFRIDGIIRWEDTGQTFNEPAPGFNPNGDGSMGIVYKIASFDNNNVLSTNPEDRGPRMTDDEIFKTDSEKRSNRLLQQLNNPITLDKLKLQNGFKDDDIPDQLPKGPKLKNGEDGNEVFRTDTERGMERLRQQLENPKKIDLSQFDKPSTTAQPDKNDEIEQLRQELGNNSERLTVDDLNQKLQNFNTKSEQNAQNDVYRTNTERGMERLRQQLENPTKIDLSKFQRKR